MYLYLAKIERDLSTSIEQAEKTRRQLSPVISEPHTAGDVTDLRRRFDILPL
jgi:hypothetical protein